MTKILFYKIKNEKKKKMTHGHAVGQVLHHHAWHGRGHLFIIIIIICLNCFRFRFSFLKLRHSCIFKNFIEIYGHFTC